MKKIVQKNIILLEDVESINKMIFLLKNKQLEPQSEIKYLLLEKQKFENVLDLEIDMMREFIIVRIHLLKKLSIYFENLDIEYVDSCLDIYKHKKVLLARFIQSLYRLATLDYISTEKSVGATIHTTLGVSSKVIGMKSLKMGLPLKMIKNHRAYNLNENQIQIDTKMSIAKKLLASDIKELDVSKIANITELPLKNIEKMHRTCFIG